MLHTKDTILMVVVIFLTLHYSAWAGQSDRDVPRPDPTGYWRIVTDDDATTTSKCIGKPISPECSMETFIAALFRADEKLRKSIIEDIEEDVEPLTKQHDTKVMYRILYAGMASKTTSTRDEDGRKINWKKGDIWIVTDERSCLKDQCESPVPEMEKYGYMRYFFYKKKNKWFLRYGSFLHSGR